MRQELLKLYRISFFIHKYMKCVKSLRLGVFFIFKKGGQKEHEEGKPQIEL